MQPANDLPVQTTDVRERLINDGFAVLPGFISAEKIAGLRGRAAAIVDAFDPSIASGIFTTRADGAKRDRYFAESANTVRCFFEEEAFDESGRLRQSKALSINKIGHAMHDLDPVFDAFSHGAELDGLARAAGLSDPRVYQSMYIFKQPHIGGEVRWHQDATFFATEPESVVTFWFALEDADRSNGCLWVQPGGHRGPLRERFVMKDDVGRMESLDNSPWPADDDALALECGAGTLVLFHGFLPHYSAPNRSPQSRHAYTLHVVDGLARYEPGNWIQRGTDFPARGLL